MLPFPQGRWYNEHAAIGKIQDKEDFHMEISSMADFALAQMPAMSAPSDISVAMLSKQLDMTQEMCAEMIKAMELSVNPGVGGNIDVYA